MTEENKETIPEAKPAEPAPKAETPAQVKEPSTPEAAKKPEEKKEANAAKVRPSNCAACNKSIKKKRWYYRNGKYYCTKRCWKTAIKKEEKSDAKAGASA